VDIEAVACVHNLQYRFSTDLTYQHKFTSTVIHYFHTSKYPDFHFKISGFSAVMKLADKSGYPHPDLQSAVLTQGCFYTG